MAPKRAPPVEDPPSASSSEDDDEEEESSSGEEEEASDDEQSQPTPPQPQTKTTRPQNSAPKKPESPTQQSESESGSESESEPDQSVRPITSKPMEETPPKEVAAAVATKKSRSKPAVAATPEKSTAVRRGNGADRDSKDLKRAKNKESDPEKSEDSKKQLFQRLWTEEDEIALLQGIIDFTAEKGYDPSKDMNSFFDFIKKSLHFDVSMTQLRDKISRLRKKFENHVKGKKGENKIFTKSHDQKGFDLSKYIWGSEGSNGKKNNSNNNKRGNAKKLEALKAELGMDVGEEDKMEVEMERDSSVRKVMKFDSSVTVGRMDEYVVRSGLNFAHGTEKLEMEEKWRKLHIAELELFLKRNELIQEQAKLMLSAFKDEKD